MGKENKLEHFLNLYNPKVTKDYIRVINNNNLSSNLFSNSVNYKKKKKKYMNGHKEVI